MIIPIRCFTCGKVIADKWEYYKEESEKIDNTPVKDKNTNKHYDSKYKEELLNKLGLDRYCCRRMFISHVEIIDNL